MPYITQEEREALKSGDIPRTAGQLNYLVTLIIHEFLGTRGLSYQTINDIVGALDGAKVEFQRTIVAPYEIEKEKLNGPIK